MGSSRRIIRPGPGPSHGRRGFLTALGGIGVAAGLRNVVQADTVFPFGGGIDEVFADDFEAPLSSCVLIPSETQGPYPLLTALGNEALYRRDIGEGRPGLPPSYRFKLVNLNAGCAPIPDAAVYVWQCDRDGVYSGYSQPGAHTVGQTSVAASSSPTARARSVSTPCTRVGMPAGSRNCISRSTCP